MRLMLNSKSQEIESFIYLIYKNLCYTPKMVLNNQTAVFFLSSISLKEINGCFQVLST